jgi:hypothetical protein
VGFDTNRHNGEGGLQLKPGPGWRKPEVWHVCAEQRTALLECIQRI